MVAERQAGGDHARGDYQLVLKFQQAHCTVPLRSDNFKRCPDNRVLVRPLEKCATLAFGMCVGTNRVAVQMTEDVSKLPCELWEA